MDLLPINLERAEEVVNSILGDVNSDGGLSVYTHAIKMIKDFKSLMDEDKAVVLFASICHDLDDHKFKKDHPDDPYHYAKVFMNSYLQRTPNKEFMERMIGLVSCSVWKNRRDEISPPWMYIPRYSDRLEATGLGGIKRAMIYGKYIERPLFSEKTRHFKVRKFSIIIQQRLKVPNTRLQRLSISTSRSSIFISRSGSNHHMLTICALN